MGDDERFSISSAAGLAASLHCFVWRAWIETMKFFSIKIEIARRTLMVSIGDRCFGIGWGVKGYWKRLDGWFLWSYRYYDGNWFDCRLGPFFYSYGPY